MMRQTMMMSEADLRNHIIKEAKAAGWHVSHIESGLTSPGIPDLALSKDDITLWLELKVMKDGNVNLRPPQRRWHRMMAQARSTSYVLVLVGDLLHPVRGATACQLRPDSFAWQAGDRWSPVELGAMLHHLEWRIRNEV